MEFMIFKTNRASERLVVKLFAAPGKSCPSRVRRQIPTPDNGAKNTATVQTSKTASHQQNRGLGG
ncbi:hypothetical protein VM99_02680 [Pseudomonas chlororaphis]|uniref:Uncharacterized protein n=1 Tax=Pseudomonas chlororaphis TaxID=587753 RepID=A0A0G3G6W6_9PSED|nr:hypothetical protein VM99_02680 [Pseudomonas chlororaphis]